MSFNVPVTSPQLTKVRSGSYEGNQNVSVLSNRVVFKCRVNADLTVGVVFAGFAYNSATIGAYSDVQIGQTILVSPVDDINQWVWRGRVRLAPTNAEIFCNETESNWSVGFYVYIIDTFEVWDRLSRPDSSTPPVQFVDFDIAYHKMAPGIKGLQYIYCGTKDAITGKFRIALNLTGVIYESGTSISSWLIAPRSGQATLISGSYSSAIATFDLDPSTMSVFGETWFTTTITDNLGNTLTRYSCVKIYDDTHTPDLSFENIQIAGDVSRGWTATLPAFAGVDSVLPWTLVCVWRDTESYGGVAGTLGALPNTIDSIGYIRKDDPSVTSDPKHTTLSTTSFEVLDIAGRMANIEMQQLAIQNGTTAAWDWINNVTPRRALWHYLTTHSTVATLVDITFDPLLSDDSYLFPDFSTQGNNLLAAGNGIGAQVNAAFEFGPDGSIEINRDLRHTDAATRSAAPIVMSLQATGSTNGITDDCVVIGSSRIYEDRIGVLDANGASFTVPPVYQSRAPGLAQGISQGRGTLANQVLAIGTGLQNQTEINQRGGDEFNIQNAQETITLEMPDGYVFGIPSRAQWYTLVADTNLAGPNGVSRIIYTSSVRCQLEQVRYNVKNADGDRKNEWILRRECPIGLPGYSVVIPAQPSASVVPFGVVPPAFNIDPLILPPVGVIVPPPNPTPLPLKGTTPTVDWTAVDTWDSNNFPGLASPTRAGILPSDIGAFRVQHVIGDLADLTVKATPVYLLASDGTNSAVWYTKNVLQQPPAWTKGTSYPGIYTLLRLTQTPGSVEMYAPLSVGVTGTVYDFSTGQHGWTIAQDGGDIGVYVAGTGFQEVQYQSPSDNYYRRQVAITLNSGVPSGITSLIAVVDYAAGTFDAGGISVVGFVPALVTYVSPPSSPVFPNGTNKLLQYSGGATSPSSLEVYLCSDRNPSSASGFSGSATIKKVIANGSIVGAQSRLSTDYGATFAAPTSIGTQPGAIGGFDVQHGGTVSFAASDQEINKATTLGGAYSAFLSTAPQEPIVILAPWWKWGQAPGGTKNTGGTPDFLYGVDAAISGETLWAVVGSTATAVSPKITGTPGVPVGPNCITTWAGTRIAGLFSFSGITHLMTGVVTNSGTPAITWTDRGALAGTYIRGKYHASAPGPLFIAGNAAEWYSADFGATVHSRTPPITSGVLGLEPCG